MSNFVRKKTTSMLFLTGSLFAALLVSNCSLLGLATDEDGNLALLGAGAAAASAGASIAGSVTDTNCMPNGFSFGGTAVTVAWDPNPNTRMMDQVGSGYRVYIGNNHYFDEDFSSEAGTLPGKGPIEACVFVENTTGGSSPTSASFSLPSGFWYLKVATYSYEDPTRVSITEDDIEFYVP